MDDDTEALKFLEGLARGLALRNGMTSGYLTISIGAGNPLYFYSITYMNDGYNEHGWAKTSGAINANGRTLTKAARALSEALTRNLTTPK